MSLISKMRTPRNRSGLGGAGRGRPPRPARRRAAFAAAGGGGGGGGGVTGGQRDSLRAAIDASIHRLGRHEQQMAVDGDVALPAGADQRSAAV